jgi:P27 family predicted phage terminase small subunit
MSAKKSPEERLRNGDGDLEKNAELVANVDWVTPAPPEGMGAESVDLWNEVWLLGGPDGIYHAIADRGLVQRYVELIARRDEMQNILGAEGYVATGSGGQDVQHPAARILSDIEGRLIAVEDRLGLSPQARHTILIGRTKAKSAFEKWNEEED